MRNSVWARLGTFTAILVASPLGGGFLSANEPADVSSRRVRADADPAQAAKGAPVATAASGLNPSEIRLKAAVFDPLVTTPSFASLERVESPGKGVRGGYLVQFDRPITSRDRKALEDAGASIHGYVPMMALEVVMTEESAQRVGVVPGVRWVGFNQPAFKVFPDLLESMQASQIPGARIHLQVSLYPGEDEPARAAIRELGGRVLHVDSGRSFVIAKVDIAKDRIPALARHPLVRYIEEVYAQEPLNDRSRFHTGASDVANDTFTAGLDPSLDGKHEASGFQLKYGHMDTGIEIAHADFSTATITFEPGADSGDLDNGHGTHTAGSLVGDGGAWATVPQVPPMSGSVSQDKWRGMTPQAAVHHISFDNGYTDTQIFERESEVGAHISSNSWGWSSFGQPITNYNTNAAAWDAGVWDADDDVAGQQPLVVFFSAGNSGGWVSPYNGCNSVGGDRIGTPGTAKNVITVGNNETDRGSNGICGSFCGSFSTLGDNVEQMNASSSRGPVDPAGTGQGLFKPDVTNIGGYWALSTEASGTASSCSCPNVEFDCPSDCSDTGSEYSYSNGTSMSAPLTAGLGGMIYQDLVANLGVTSPKPSLVKALLINGARDLQPTACNYTYQVNQTVIHEGWGFVQTKNSLYGPAGSPAGRNIEFENEVTANAVSTGGQYQRQITVNAGTALRVTLVWTDYPAAAGAISPLVVNDLDLEVSGPSGTFLGNNFSGNFSVTGGAADRFNVVENVYIQTPVSGTYTITVKGFQVSQDQEQSLGGVNQDFSLVWSGDLGAGCTVPADCDDGLFCNGSESCVSGSCQAGTPPSCADGVACTTDSCNEGTDSCDHTPNNAACGDGLFCNGSETCHATLGCQAGTPPNCADAVACTTDSCNEGTDSCDHTPNNAACGDGLFCNGSETCHATLGCQAGSDPCPGATCDETNDVCISSAEVWMSFYDTTTVPGVGNVENEDIVARNVSTGVWSMIFDGSDVGLSGFTIDGMARLASGDILLSFTAAGTITGMTGGPSGSTTLDDSDIVRFVPGTLGANTSGSFVFYFDGSDVGLTTNNEDIDAIALTSSGSLVISTVGSASATGASGSDTDLLLFTATTLGAATSGSFSMYFDGSDVGLSDSSEDLDAAGLRSNGSLLLSTTGAVSVPGVSAADEDILQFTGVFGAATSGSYSLFLDLSALGIATAENVGSVEYKE